MPAREDPCVTGVGEIDHWDRIAAVYAQQIGDDGDSFFRRLAPFLQDQFGDVAGRDVLDLGMRARLAG
jgi:hypothetical protein